MVVSTGVFMSTLDSSIVNIALPSIMETFGSPLRTTEWVVMSYLLTVTATLLFWGGLSDFWGRRRVYSFGMFVFAAGSLACAGAQAISWLIAARFMQAVGAAMMMATGPAILRDIFPRDQLGRTFGLIGVTVSIGLMSGPALGGFLVQYYSWRSIFLVTVPVGALFSFLAILVIPKGRSGWRLVGFDWYGALCWALALVSGLWALVHISGESWREFGFWLRLGACFLFTYLFIRVERVVSAPILPLSLFRERFFSSAVVSAVLSFITLFTVNLLTPFYLERILSLSTSRTGMVMMSVPLATMVVAPVAGRLSDSIGYRYITTAGILLNAVSLMLLALLTAETRPLDVVWRLVLLGCGQAMFLSPNSASILGKVDKLFIGVSSGLLATARNLGMSLGVALAGIIFSLLFSLETGGLDLRDFSPVHTSAFMVALKGSFWAAALIGGIGVWCSWERGKET